MVVEHSGTISNKTQQSQARINNSSFENNSSSTDFSTVLPAEALLGNDGRDAFFVMRSAYYDRTCLWSADIFTSIWQENFLFL